MEVIKIEKVWTVGEVINWTNGYFESKAIDSPKKTSEKLMEWVLGVDKTHLYINWKKELDKETLGHYKVAIKRVVEGEPLAYIIGKQYFYAYEFKVNDNVLIPRPETEELVEWIISENREKSGLKILDLCTGSGAIGITLAKLLKDSTVVATDIDAECIKIAKENATLNGVLDRMEFLTGDLFEPVFERLSEFDVIVSNPPYISHDEKPLMDKSVLKYEPHKALFGGKDGLDFYRRINKNRDRLSGKVVYFEAGFNQKESLEALFSDLKKEYKRDISGNWRMFRITF